MTPCWRKGIFAPIARSGKPANESPVAKENFHRGVGGQSVEQFGDGFVVTGQSQGRADIGERLEYETPSAQTRVRNGECRGGSAEISRVKDVEVELPRSIFVAGSRAALADFKSGEFSQQLVWIEGAFDFHHGVEKRGRTCRAIHRFGFVNGRDGRPVGALVQRHEEIAAEAEIFHTVSEV